ncbi:MAG: PQQ-binding-like beta-propeller repeat protein [Bacteroidota bacterium]|jgi:hypothetical protein
MYKKLSILLLISVVIFSINAQTANKTIELKNKLGIDKLGVSSQFVYCPVLDSLKKIEIIRIELNTGNQSGKFIPPVEHSVNKEFVIENDFIFYHSTGFVSKYNLVTGEKIWSGSYEISSENGTLILSGTYACVAQEKSVALFDKNSGKLLYNVKTAKIDEEHLSVNGDKLYVYSDDDKAKIMCYDLKTQKVLWKTKLADVAGLGMTFDEQQAYITDINDQLYCLNINNGKLIWKHKYKIEDCMGYSPILNKDEVITITSGGLFVFNKNTGKIMNKILIEGAGKYTYELFRINDNLYFGTKYYVHKLSLMDYVNKNVAKISSAVLVNDGYTLYRGTNQLILSNFGKHKEENNGYNEKGEVIRKRVPLPQIVEIINLND